MAISEIKVQWRARWYLKPVAVVAGIACRLRLISNERFASVVVGCYDAEVIK